MPHVNADDVQNLWDRLDNAYNPDDYSPREIRDIHDAMADMAEAVANGQSVMDSDGFWDFLDLTGLDSENFPWDDFRDWYDGL
jgi:hypothetical protein